MKKRLIILLTILLIPFNVLAYSNYIIPGGENIGISINSKGIIVIGRYKNINKRIKNGDIITKIDGMNVNNMDELSKYIDSNKHTVEILRNNKKINIELEVIEENGIYRTGLYVKDNITGIGTLSYIDPETKSFGALGHEVSESNTGTILNVKNGKIYNSSVTDIERSESGNPGSKDATISDNEIGNINKNTKKGIFGKINDIPNKKKYKVANISYIKLGKAKILTVINDNKINEYEIEIKKILDDNSNKNILFEITDSELLNKTGGIVQGMSGSPIIQDDYIIGAVTHVVINNPKYGYGIYIKNMLEESEK